VVDGVVAVLARHLPRVDAERLQGPIYGLRAAGEADDARVESLEILADDRLRIALGIDRDEIDLQPVGVGAERLQPGCRVEERRWADIGAEGVAEIDQRRMARERGLGDGRAVLIGEREGR
jgi:hypothetical protein